VGAEIPQIGPKTRIGTSTGTLFGDPKILLLKEVASSNIQNVKKIYNYPVLIDHEDRRYIVSCPAFPGCVAQASTYEEALKEISEGISIFIEIHKKKRWPLPQQSTPTMTIVKVAVNE
jgi:predicted RNase H-like HicB family nuclease